MNHVISKDGTSIAMDRLGDGPSLILVDGAFGHRAFPSGLADRLAASFTVFRYDRRGRGDSGDTAPYTTEKEVDDLAAVLKAAGGAASVFGMSSGAVLALDAARRLPIRKLALYEPPFLVDDSRSPQPEDYVAQLDALVEQGRRGDAVAYFLERSVEVPAEMVAGMRASPMWPALEAVAHTLAYDGRVMGDTMRGRPLPAERWAQVSVPTLVLDGGASPRWMRQGVRALAERLQTAEHRTLDGQTHDVDPNVLAPVLTAFFSG